MRLLLRSACRLNADVVDVEFFPPERELSPSPTLLSRCMRDRAERIILKMLGCKASKSKPEPVVASIARAYAYCPGEG